MINEREIIYQIELIQAEINYFERYKKNLTKYFLDDIRFITKAKANKIIKEISNVGLEVYKLNYLQKEYYKLLNKQNYGIELDN